MLISPRQIKSDGEDVLELSKQLKNTIDSLYKEIIDIPKNNLWVGLGAENFSSAATEEMKNVIEFENKIVEFGKFLVNSGNSYEKQLATSIVIRNGYFPKLYLNSTGVRINILGKLDNAVSKCNTSIYDVGYLRVPYNFEYAQYVKEIFNDIERLKNNLVDKKQKIQNSISGYEKIEKNNLNLITTSVKFELPKRVNKF